MFASRTTTRALLSRRAQRVDVRRGLRVSSQVHAPEMNRVAQNASSKSSGWSQPKVFAVALGAGALGWGLANLSGDGDSAWSRSSAPHYANVSEMEKANSSRKHANGYGLTVGIGYSTD